MTDNGWWSRHLGTDSPAPVRPQVTAPAPQPQQQYRPVPQQQAPQGEINIMDAVSMWQGGEGVRDARYCPRCGGTNLFSRSQDAVRGPAPAPMCWDCGYTGLFTQGDPSSWGG